MLSSDYAPAEGRTGHGTPSSRLAAVRATGLFDSPATDPGPQYLDHLTARVARVLAVPLALATLATEQEEVVVGAAGLPGSPATRPRTPLARSFCELLISTGSAVVIEDVRMDDRWSDDPTTATADPTTAATVAYAGFPLRAPDGQVLGSFCVIDIRPRSWAAPDLSVLESLAEAATAELARLSSARELRASALELRRVLDNSSDLVRTVEVLPNGRFHAVFSTANTQDVLGGELTGDPDVDVNDTLYAMVHPEDRGEYERFRQRLRTGLATELEYRVVGVDGVTRWVWTRATIRREHGQMFVDAITRNITQRKQVELDLEEERRRLRQAQTIAGIGSWEWDVQRDVVSWSESLYDLYGVDPAKFTANDANDHVIHPEDVAQMGALFKTCARTGEPLRHRYRVVRPVDGRVRIFEARGEALYGAGADVVRLAGTSTDVTDQVRTQREVEAREATLKAILANRGGSIHVRGAGGAYLQATEALLRAAVEDDHRPPPF